MNIDYDAAIDKYRDVIVERIQSLVRIRSVEETPEEGMPFGRGPYEALNYMLTAGTDLGFSVKNYDGYAGHIEYGENRGNGYIGVLVHVDVVPEGEGWTVPPYEGRRKDGRIYGRGAYDDKGACIAVLYALKALKDSGYLPRRNIRIIIGANEETGMRCIPYYLRREPEPESAFSPDAPFPVIYGEKGIIDLSFELHTVSSNEDATKAIIGGKSAKYVPASCTARLKVESDKIDDALHILRRMEDQFRSQYSYDESQHELSVTILGKEAYGTEPEKGKNAIAGMMRFLGQLENEECSLTPFIREFNRTIGTGSDGAGLGCDFKDAISTPLTFNAGSIEYTGGELRMKVHIRYPITANHEDILEAIRNNFRVPGISIQTERHSAAHLVDRDSSLVQTLMRIYRNATGDSEAEPITMNGGTYARTLRNAVAFGPLFPEEEQVAHSPDEYLNINSILKAAKIYAEAMYILSDQ
ncbi:MAG: dipeptidase PepV [Sediminispirochaetaceae bacterium]